MRYSSQWIPCRILFVNPYTRREVKVRPSLNSLQYFTHQDIEKNLKHSPSIMVPADEAFSENTVWVPQDDMETFLMCGLLKNYLKLDGLKNIVIGALDAATYIYLHKRIPDLMQYVGKDYNVDLLIENAMETLKIFDDEESEAGGNGEMN
ncbi:hypothetical protein TNIN_259331 [Trichonephila inaurata madagascariensis]|uniref:Uncharacterized protein n=1 Tax=Trichonephila inaurata madagascariensis TaxID=2747483 RepID=A0A8X6XLV0_9ARAC|nr:hypothetical protein TNIN_259331 [Trichonephila inaurata madagascariensis]